MSTTGAQKIASTEENSRAQVINLSEEFFSKKPYQEEHEIAELLKELGAEDSHPVKKKKGGGLPTVVGVA
ncbi:MAG TPA: hypothetical protein PKH10_00455, partial [bacterium]|nr:hypothetical protein [bacterium]